MIVVRDSYIGESEIGILCDYSTSYQHSRSFDERGKSRNDEVERISAMIGKENIGGPVTEFGNGVLDQIQSDRMLERWRSRMNARSSVLQLPTIKKFCISATPAVRPSTSTIAQ